MDRTAQGIASKGRFGDTTLVHMAPSELKGIEQLAGTPVTYNPETGLPEMFGLKEFLAIAAPAAGAAILGPAFAGSALLGGGVGAGALGAGVGSALGTLVAGGNSDEALQSGLITGLTAGIGGSLFGGKAGAPASVEGGTGQGINLGADIPTTTAATTPSTTTITPPTGSPSFVYDPNISPMNVGADIPVNVEGVTAPDTGGGLFRNMFSGIKQRAQDTEAYKEPAKAIGYGLSGTVGGISTAPMVANTLEDDSPKYGDIDMSDPYRRQVTFRRGLGSREGQFFNPSGMYIKEGGYIKNMQEGGTVGIVKGPGDGMSDSIYGTMRDVPNQQVALSDGEFVVPSDIVSGIGNGSTDAGAEKLYAMMDRVRNARTGQVQQAPEINPEEFLPA